MNWLRKLFGGRATVSDQTQPKLIEIYDKTGRRVLTYDFVADKLTLYDKEQET